MRTLCIIRHAKTEVQQQGQLDFDRHLAHRAYSDAPEVVKVLKDKHLLPDKIISSPAMRAISTARIVAEKLGYPENKIEQNSLIYNASVSTLLKVVQSLDDEFKTIFIIGHNPGVTLLSNILCLPPIVHIPTSGVVCIEFDVKHWNVIKALSGKQKFFVYP